MPTFMDSLRNNPGGSGVYGQPGATSDQDVLGLVNQIKDREMQDFQKKASFMADLSLKQDRLRSLYDPNLGGSLDGRPSGDSVNRGSSSPDKMNTVMGTDPNQITPIQQAELGIKQQGMNLESQKLAQSGKMGQEALDIKTKQEQLNQQKSDQINAQKTADLQRKIDDSNQKLQLAQEKLKQAGDNQAAILEAHKALAAAVEERHQAEMDQKQHQFDTVNAQHLQTIKDQEAKLKQGSKSQTTTELNANGTKKTVTTQKGNTQTVTGTGKDGKQYQVPIDQIDDWNANHAQPGTEIDNSDNEDTSQH